MIPEIVVLNLQDMFKILLLIGSGGFLGCVSRYLLQDFVMKRFPSAFPFGTFLVNVSGCFLIGLIYGLSVKSRVLSEALRFLLATGFCGGFTTFSTFSYESLALLKEGNYLYCGLYISLSILVGILATFAGYGIIQQLVRTS
jgi:CrcB protein